MNVDAFWSLLAVVIGGVLTISGGFVSNVLLERQRLNRESRSLALAFKGEIAALLNHIEMRGYSARFQQVIEQIETTRQPFFMPFNIRHSYDRVYANNLENIGQLKGPLPEMIPVFYTLLSSIMEDLENMGDKIYAELDLETLLRIYRDVLRLLEYTHQLGSQIMSEIDTQYDLPPSRVKLGMRST